MPIIITRDPSSHVNSMKVVSRFQVRAASQDRELKHLLSTRLRSARERRQKTSGFESAATKKMCAIRSNNAEDCRRTFIHCRTKYCREVTPGSHRKSNSELHKQHPDEEQRLPDTRTKRKYCTRFQVRTAQAATQERNTS